MAVEDPHVEVRQWMARYGRSLDYREQGIRFLPDVHEAGPETESEGGRHKENRPELKATPLQQLSEGANQPPRLLFSLR